MATRLVPLCGPGRRAHAGIPYRVGKRGFDVTDFDRIITLSGIRNLPHRLLTRSDTEAGSTPQEMAVLLHHLTPVLFTLCFNIGPNVSLHHSRHFLPPFRRSLSRTCAPVGVVTCLYILLLAITAHSAFLRLLTISTRLRSNNTLRSCPKLCHSPFPLRHANLPKFSFQNSEL